MTTPRSTYYVQTSTDGGKTFATVTRTTNRDRAFRDFVDLGQNDGRVVLFTNNRLTMASHLADAIREVTLELEARDRVAAR